MESQVEKVEEETAFPTVPQTFNDETDWDPTDDDEEGEALGNDRPSEDDKGFHFCDQSVTQETSATSELSHTGTHAEENFADFRECTLEQGHVQTPTQEDGEDSWAEFKDRGLRRTGELGPSSKSQSAACRRMGHGRGAREGGRCGGSRRNSCQASLSCRVQQLLVAHFPEVEVPAVESLSGFGGGCGCHTRTSMTQLPQVSVGGSYANRILLRCFIGMKKQPVAVPAFASGLGNAGAHQRLGTSCQFSTTHSRHHHRENAPKPPGSPDHSTYSMQEALPPRQLSWSSSQDGTSPRRAPHFWGWK
ncbi:hypothetical protein KUCAC02_024078 [Chaenocephalus aceratus]|uniref:Uncharacterized protein n=1 Tax=Chaenocephalus aceratus TaxID=36190 RepID=A0ACB9WGS3_CHAAC|nr:hypothetical protein KUCAC02_024078 [Chaenocephalus aceratus]